jgi:hypothetical protein
VPRRLCRAVLLCLTLTPLLFACSGASPEILYADAQLFLVNDLETGERYESIRLFVSVNDEDGPDDVAVLYVDHTASELYWEFDSSVWVQTEFTGDSWFGVPDLRMPAGEAFPRGRYRVIVEDGALHRSEGSFSITAEVQDPDSLVFPSLRHGDVPTVVAEEPVILRVYTRAGQMPINEEVVPGPVDASVLDALPDETGLTAYLSTRPGGYRLVAGPFDLER